MSDKPLISIIIPVYNSENYLRQCLDSVINQSLKDIEILCINDGSTDKSLNILQEYKEKDNRVQIFDIKNHGAAYARNLGIKNAIGEFIGFCDSDDYVDNKYFETLYSHSKNYDIVRGTRVIGKNNAHVKNEYGCIIPSIIRRKFLMQTNILFPTTKKVGEDAYFKRQILKKTNKIFECPETDICYHYMKREGSLSCYSLPLVSVLLTVYNIKKEYLDECIDSIIHQTYDNLEILIIDDGSTIDYNYLTELSPQIKLIKNEKNLGLCKSLNKLFSYVKGKYYVRLGSDDIFDSTLIEKEVLFLEKHPNVGAICCELQRFGTSSTHIKRPVKWDLNKILKKDLTGTGYDGGVMVRSSLLKNMKVDESLKMAEDFDLQLQVLEQMPIESIHEILYYYRTHETNLCKSVTKTERHKIIDKIIEKHTRINKKPTVKTIRIVNNTIHPQTKIKKPRFGTKK